MITRTEAYKIHKLEDFIRFNQAHRYRKQIEQYIKSFYRSKLDNPTSTTTDQVKRRIKEFYPEDAEYIFQLIEEES